jgi:hypothetical protein
VGSQCKRLDGTVVSSPATTTSRIRCVQRDCNAREAISFTKTWAFLSIFGSESFRSFSLRPSILANVSHQPPNQDDPQFTPVAHTASLSASTPTSTSSSSTTVISITTTTTSGTYYLEPSRLLLTSPTAVAAEGGTGGGGTQAGPGHTPKRVVHAAVVNGSVLTGYIAFPFLFFPSLLFLLPRAVARGVAAAISSSFRPLRHLHSFRSRSSLLLSWFLLLPCSNVVISSFSLYG